MYCCTQHTRSHVPGVTLHGPDNSNHSILRILDCRAHGSTDNCAPPRTVWAYMSLADCRWVHVMVMAAVAVAFASRSDMLRLITLA